MTLNVAHNRIAKFPPVSIKNPSIHSIDASDNLLEELPTGIQNLTRLTSLDVSNNRLVQLPVEIGLLRYLEKLNVSSNQLTFLPDEIGDIGFAMCEFYATGNRLTSLPETFGQFPTARHSGSVAQPTQAVARLAGRTQVVGQTRSVAQSARRRPTGGGTEALRGR